MIPWRRPKPKPPKPPPAADSTRVRCPACGAGGAEVLFNVVRCAARECRNYDEQHAERRATEDAGLPWYYAGP